MFGSLYFLNAAISYGLTMPTGLFTPSIVFGAVMGRLYAHCLTWMGVTEVDPGLYALLGVRLCPWLLCVAPTSRRCLEHLNFLSLGFSACAVDDLQVSSCSIHVSSAWLFVARWLHSSGEGYASLRL